MCGILCQICYSQSSTINDYELQKRIENRGPDNKHQSTITFSHLNITFCGAVLWTQGQQVTCQPLENEYGILLFNGDIFDQTWDCEKSDTMQIMEKISKPDNNSSSHQIIEEIKKFKGPSSLIYYNKMTQDLIFTRDKIGRNSLLFHKNGHCILISSVLGRKYECVEIPTTHIYLLNLKQSKLTLFSWDEQKYNETIDVDEWLKSVKLLQSQPDEKFFLEDNLCDDFSEDNIIKYIEHVTSEYTDKHTIMTRLLQDSWILKTVQKIIDLLNLSVKVRVEKQPQICNKCMNKTSPCSHSCIGVLFSGGLDCTLLAYLADKYVSKEQSIDLINVAFNKDAKSSFDVPDRLTGIQSLDELKQLCPHRKWVFRQVNVSKDVLLEQQEKTIADLVYPRQTILDESLGSALWFAAQSEDQCTKSPCRILLVGSGADELFGGYTRHRNAFKRGGWKSLHKELILDWKRISFRNLARDNRVICDHGRQPRMPYLDEDFVNYVLSLKPWFKCFPSNSLGPGIGDKLFLRLAAFNVGLVKVATLPKRALQFGSRIANKNEKGSDLSPKLINIKL